VVISTRRDTRLLNPAPHHPGVTETEEGPLSHEVPKRLSRGVLERHRKRGGGPCLVRGRGSYPGGRTGHSERPVDRIVRQKCLMTFLRSVGRASEIDSSGDVVDGDARPAEVLVTAAYILSIYLDLFGFI
jgi:hypothetical protein